MFHDRNNGYYSICLYKKQYFIEMLEKGMIRHTKREENMRIKLKTQYSQKNINIHG
jgi:hypothetical protein